MTDEQSSVHPDRAHALENTAFTVGEVAKNLGVPRGLVQGWLDDGRLIGAKNKRGGAWKMHPNDVPTREAALRALRKDAAKAFEAVDAIAVEAAKFAEAVSLDAREALEAIRQGDPPPIGDDLRTAYRDGLVGATGAGLTTRWLMFGEAIRYAEWLVESLEPEDLPIHKEDLIQ